MSDRELMALGAHVAEQEDLLLDSAAGSEAARRAIARRAASRRPARSGSWRAFALAGAFAGVVAALFFFADALLREQKLSFTVGKEARPGELHAWEAAPAKDKLPLRFSDGTKLELEPAARAQVVRLDPTGAEVVLDSGRARFDVVPRKDGDWRVRTGPIVVYVKGTRFDFSWDEHQEEFWLHLYEGSVVIRGCSFGDGQRFERGQEAHGFCRGKQASAPEVVTPKALEQLAPPAVTAESGPLPERPSRASAPRASWRSLARDGHFRLAYDAAVLDGFEAECEAAGASDLMLLGDAARLSAQRAAATQAYTSARRRFPGSDAAARAAFTLGRLAFDSGDHATAMRWFETYLAEQPSGALAPSAFDRLLETALRSGDSQRTKSIAERYLARYPSGAYADEARRILGR